MALSGDGGDELFAGYEMYERAETLLNFIEGIPLPLRDAVRNGVGVFSPRTWDMVLRPLKRLISGGKLHRVTGEKLYKWGSFMSLDRPEVFRRLASHCLNPGLVIHGGTEPPTAFTDPARQNRSGDFLDFMMALDLVSYLPDDILVKVDRAAMGVSLETASRCWIRALSATLGRCRGTSRSAPARRNGLSVRCFTAMFHLP